MAHFQQAWETEYKLNLHKKQLQKIKSGGDLRVGNTFPHSLSLGKLIVQRKDFKKTQDSIAVYKSNKILLAKLEKISKRKSSYSANLIKAPKTLNYNLRMDSLKNIAKENFKVFQRIKSKEASLCQKQLENEFKAHERIKKLLSRKKLFPSSSEIKLT